jgi:hypothetical protein
MKNFRKLTGEFLLYERRSNQSAQDADSNDDRNNPNADLPSTWPPCQIDGTATKLCELRIHLPDPIVSAASIVLNRTPFEKPSLHTVDSTPAINLGLSPEWAKDIASWLENSGMTCCIDLCDRTSSGY